MFGLEEVQSENDQIEVAHDEKARSSNLQNQYSLGGQEVMPYKLTSSYWKLINDSQPSLFRCFTPTVEPKES